MRRVAAFARPHRRTIVAFLALATASAVLGVATPVLAGQAVDAIVEAGHQHRDPGWPCSSPSSRSSKPAWACSSACSPPPARRGRDPRPASPRSSTTCRRMPIAFFTRTRTGALVSRLNNDVIGAQRAFTPALSGVVTNVVALALTLVVMLGACPG